MKYFSFVYDQRTLIVAAPDDNKGQEKFLGYKWSNRKGQEGIQIIDEGGMLYDAENRMSDRTIASLIRKMFNGEEVSLDDLEEYYYYLHTKDMISFSEVYFNKAIKTTKTRLLKLTRGEGRTPMPEREKLHLMARSQSTMCIFLSAGIAEQVQEELLQEYPETTPVAVCYHLTWKDEQIFRGELKDLARIVKENNLTLTTMIVVGEAIGNREGLSRLYAHEFKHLYRK